MAETETKIPLHQGSAANVTQCADESSILFENFGDKFSNVAEVTSKPSFSFMKYRNKYRVVKDNGADVTPNDIVNHNYVTMEHTFSHAAFEPRQRRAVSLGNILSSNNSISTSKLKFSHFSRLSGLPIYAIAIDLDDIHIDHTADTEESYRPGGADLDQAPSANYQPKDRPLMAYPREIFVTLKETDTVCLFYLPSCTYDRETDDGAAIEKENEHYEYITVGKGRNRKTIDQETQTKQRIFQTRHTLASRPKNNNQISFASLWEMHDTYTQIEEREESEQEDEMVMYPRAAPHLLRKKRLQEKNNLKHSTWESLAELPQFQDASLLCERVLAAKHFSEAQKTFRGLVSVNRLAKDLVYIYTMKPLWSFECGATVGRPILSVSFNPMNPNILAAGHGKFGYAEKLGGIVSVWCTKNPCTPERLYSFEVPVTSVSFSKKRPNWLAVAFDNGEICILDITSYTINIIAKSSRKTNPSFEPIWMTSWHEKDKFYVMTAGQDGRINRFAIATTKTQDFICTPMMRISSVVGNTKGLDTRQCFKVDVPITRYPAALCVLWHPAINHVYFVGTSQGYIHKCSTHYLNQHMNVFQAHAGPVYNMVCSPFMPQLMVTCGADNAIRLWIDNLDDVIMTLNCDAAVYDVAFCPVNATILISASGNVLSVWDLRRKAHVPCTEYSFPGNVVLTYVKFSSSGDNLFVADTMGRIHTFHLEDTPIPPYYQREMLEDAIKKALCNRPQLLLQLAKLEDLKKK